MYESDQQFARSHRHTLWKGLEFQADPRPHVLAKIAIPVFLIFLSIENDN